MTKASVHWPKHIKMETFTPKDKTITQVLTRLESDLGPAVFLLADHWTDDLMAVGIACPSDPRYLVYISTLGCATGNYYVELELPPKANEDFPYTPAGSFNTVDYAALCDIVVKHLERGKRSPLIDPPAVGQ